jgi:hypothetical protein
MRHYLLLASIILTASFVAQAQNTVVNSLILKGDNGYRVTLTAPTGLTGNLSIPLPAVPAGGTLLASDATGNLVLGAASYIQLTEPASGGGLNWTRLQAGTQTSDFTLTLPTAAPTVNQVLTATAVTGGSVTLGWTTPSGGGGGGGATETGFSRTTAATSITTTTLGDVAGLSVSWGVGTSGTRTYHLTLMFDYVTPAAGPNGLDIRVESLGSGSVTSSKFVLAAYGPLPTFQVNNRVSVDDGNFWAPNGAIPVVYQGYVVVDDNVTGVKVQAALRTGTSQTYSIPLGSAISYIRVN